MTKVIDAMCFPVALRTSRVADASAPITGLRSVSQPFVTQVMSVEWPGRVVNLMSGSAGRVSACSHPTVPSTMAPIANTRKLVINIPLLQSIPHNADSLAQKCRHYYNQTLRFMQLFENKVFGNKTATALLPKNSDVFLNSWLSKRATQYLLMRDRMRLAIFSMSSVFLMLEMEST